MPAKASIIVPIYNVARYVRECVDSLLAQTYTELEIILVDDGSPDESGAICDEYAAKDGRVRVIHQLNRGVSAARNAGLEAATGKYVQFVDADDLLMPEATELFVREMESHDVGLVIGSFESVYEQPGAAPVRVPNVFFPGIKNAFDFAVIPDWRTPERYGRSHDETVYVWGKLFHRAVIESKGLRFCRDLYFQEDVVFMMRYYSAIRQVATLDRIVYHYRRMDGSASSRFRLKRNWIQNDEAVYEAISGIIESWPGLDSERKRDGLRHLLNRHAMTAISSVFTLCLHTAAGKSISEIRRLVSRDLFQRSLREYVPAKGFSRSVPFFLRWKMPVATYFALCWHLVKKRILKRLAGWFCRNRTP